MNQAAENKMIAEARAAIKAGHFDVAARQLRRAAANGDAAALFLLGELYFCSDAVSAEEALQCMKKACEAGYAEACYRMVCSFDERNGQATDLKAISSYLVRAAELGSINAQNALAVYYATGDVLGEVRPELAIRWYRKAAESGHIEAQFNLAFMLLEGNADVALTEEAVMWLRTAASSGHQDAARLLSEIGD